MIADRKRRAEDVVRVLAEEYPEAQCELDYHSVWQLLVATVLSAQCTDARVNKVTPGLFSRWPGPGDLAGADREDVENVIRSTGMFRRKAASLISTAKIIAKNHGNSVPAEMDQLVELPGVGRKTAKVVLGEGFGIAAGVTVDTHVRRLARRLGLSQLVDAEKIAAELEALVPREQWIQFSTRLILHGRRVCGAKSPHCENCVLSETCPRVGI